jgi:hypothetical protein
MFKYTGAEPKANKLDRLLKSLSISSGNILFTKLKLIRKKQINKAAGSVKTKNRELLFNFFLVPQTLFE